MNAETIKNNFGKWVLSLAIVLMVYGAVEVFAPQYSSAFAIITLLGIVMFQMNRKAD